MSDTPMGEGWVQGSDGRWYPPAPAKKRGCLKAALVVAVLGIVGMVGCSALLSDAADDVDEEQEERKASIQDDAELLSCETSETGWMTASVRITNDSSDRSNYTVDVVFTSPDGSEQYDSGTAVASNLAAGQTTTKEANSLSEPPGEFDCEISDVFRFSDEP